MSHTPHELAEEFPEFVAVIRHLREKDGHFHRLSNAYHDVNKVIHRVETNLAPLDDLHVADLRKERLRLKDEIYGMLVRHEPVPASVAKE